MTTAAIGSYVAEPHWRTRKQWRQAQISTDVASWLFDSSSLTLRLQRHCKAEFRVQVFKQSWQKPLRNEALRLQQPPEQYALVRQVHLFCDGLPVVYARTVIPRMSLQGKHRHLASLGQRSLGAVLFADKSLQRSEIEVCRVGAQHKLHRRAFQFSYSGSERPLNDIWGRRSIFTLQKKSLLVSELFLPAIAYT